jgi:hypothetical protein
VRRLLVALLVLVTLLVVADRVAAVAAERVVAERIQADQHLSHRPDVTIRGFPFLTQLVSGHYDRVDLSVHGLHSGSLVVSRVVAHLSGVDLPLSDVVRQQVRRVAVAHATAEVDLDYAEVNRLLAGKHLRLGAGADGRVHVTATAAGIDIGGDVPLTVQNSALLLALPAGQSVQIPLPGLPFGIRLVSARAESGGIVVRCSAEGLVVRPLK